MCGICGIISSRDDIKPSDLLKMTRVLRHRGPDDEGFILGDIKKNIIQAYHHDETVDSIKSKIPRLDSNLSANLGFGFRRLSILDLSENGHQPMQFEGTGLWIIYNGEIYNYIEIRHELETYGYTFNSNTDTEVILKAYHRWGEACVNKFNGMWAFALWDSLKLKLFCSRDRFGIKPFYYHYIPDSHFIFASEIKAILQMIKTLPDQRVIFRLFSDGYSDNDERTFFENIKQLRGGHNLILHDGQINVKCYYTLKSRSSRITFEKAKTEFRELLFDSVSIRLRSDVPLGYALSGGIDSSSIVGIASEINKGSNNTFSMIYPGEKIDESCYINRVVEKTGVKHFSVTPAPEDFLRDINQFIWHQEEPFIGTSYFGEYKLRELIRQNNITVSLEGQGADEIVTGYTSLLLPYFFDLIDNLRLLEIVSEYKSFRNNLGDPVRILRSYLKKGKQSSGSSLTSKYPYLNKDYFSDLSYYEKDFDNFNSGSHLNDALYEMLIYTSIPQQLVRADKNSMAFSVECRFPFLDYRVVEYGINLRYDYKTRNGMTKYILREALKDLLPVEVYNRRDKIGFAVPNDCFNSSQIKNYFYELINSGSNTISFIDTQIFIDEYLSKKSEAILDWKFWKTISTVLWWNKFHMNSD